MTRSVLAVVLLGVMIVGSLWVLRPFVPALVWATLIVIPTWPLMLRVQALCGGRRKAAVAIMTLSMAVLVIVPLSMAVTTIAEHASEGVTLINRLAEAKLPPPPAWVGDIPLVGDQVARDWRKLAAAKPEDLAARLQPYVAPAAKWIAAQAGHLGMLLLHVILTVIIAAILYAEGETAAEGIRRFARKVAAAHGDAAITLAGQSIRAVALGIVVTAVVQSLLGAVGLLVAGVPAVAVLTSAMFMLCIAQIGPGLVLLPAVGWLYWTGSTGWGTALLIWSILVMTLDNVLRPILIRRGADLPLLLIFAGVIGGLLAFGIVGLFVGPVILAVTYTLLNAWIDETEPRTGS